MSVRDIPLVKAIVAQFGGGDVVDLRLPLPADNGTPAAAGERRSYSLGDLQKTLRDESYRITATQEALVRMGDREEPHAGEMLRAAHFEASAALIDKCKADPTIMDHLKRGAT